MENNKEQSIPPATAGNDSVLELDICEYTKRHLRYGALPEKVDEERVYPQSYEAYES